MGEQALAWAVALGLAVLIPLLVRARKNEEKPVPIEIPADDEPRAR
jgi:hypothetical protein